MAIAFELIGALIILGKEEWKGTYGNFAYLPEMSTRSQVQRGKTVLGLVGGRFPEPLMLQAILTMALTGFSIQEPKRG